MSCSKIIFLIFFFSLNSAYGSDHIDGVATIVDGQADLSDFYVFEAPEDPNKLVFVLNTYPGVGKRGHFSAKVGYEIFISPIELAGSPAYSIFKGKNKTQFKLKCLFTDPNHHGPFGMGGTSSGVAQCGLYENEQELASAEGVTGEVHNGSDMRIFTGPRSDVFFLSVDHFVNVTGRKAFETLQEGVGDNGVATVNVLSIVIEIKKDMLMGKTNLWGFSARSFATNTKEKKTIDRVGRPEITNLSLHDFSKENPLKRAYNKTHPLRIPKEIAETAADRIQENMLAYDQLDGESDWDATSAMVVASTLAFDHLVMDLTKPCKNNGRDFLAMELSFLMGREHSSCGGRGLKDDIMKDLYALYIGGAFANYINFETGVSYPYQQVPNRELSVQFPYLDRSGTTSWKQWLGLKFLEFTQE